jgi:hypothetical protein
MEYRKKEDWNILLRRDLPAYGGAKGDQGYGGQDGMMEERKIEQDRRENEEEIITKTGKYENTKEEILYCMSTDSHLGRPGLVRSRRKAREIRTGFRPCFRQYKNRTKTGLGLYSLS